MVRYQTALQPVVAQKSDQGLYGNVFTIAFARYIAPNFQLTTVINKPWRLLNWLVVIVSQDLEVRAGARTLLHAPGQHLRVQPGDRIGLIGRNGAGKTTTMRILSGETQPYAGEVRISGDIGYLPQDSREGNIEQTARDRVLSARGLDELRKSLDKQQQIMETTLDDDKRDKAITKFSKLEERYHSLGGYEADSEAATICDNLGLEQRILDQPLKTLSGGQRRRVELAQILFAATSGAGKSQTTLLLDEPTNHLDADSISWLRSFLAKHEGGLVMISHDVELLRDVCNKVWFLDAVRSEADVYNMGYEKYLDARATDEARRRRERANAERKHRRCKSKQRNWVPKLRKRPLQNKCLLVQSE